MNTISTRLLLVLLSQNNTRPGFNGYRSGRINQIAKFSSSAPNDFECHRIFPPFDRELHEFYRNNFSPQRNKRVVPSLPRDSNAHDAIYVLTKQSCDSQKKDIVVALRLTRSNVDKEYTFLRSLCCAKEHRRQGLGLHLVRASLQSYDSTCCYYCFASSDLVGFYQEAGFVRIPPNVIKDTMSNYTPAPKWLLQYFKSMADRWNQRGKSLELFLHYPVQKFPTHIVLLQHCSEVSKSTATGWLVDDNLYHDSIGYVWPSVVPLGPRVHVHRWVWSGRNDNVMIEKKIQDLASNFRLFLLWTGGSRNEEETQRNSEEQTESVYIILDGTWQEAQKMFRKVPLLWNLPRISFSDIPSSKYTLRRDYTGWRERFSTRSDGGGDLLCTSEVMATLLGERGDVIGANEIRCRLDVFQMNYPLIQEQRQKSKHKHGNDLHGNDSKET
ncbi:hypothetical protein HJC23_012625 [Cyclotella cryptica]|uniref:tRNA-uridine aminocarboxypropyltransferase n=1 Tax=Cyclotella cryptica TaxID=29204 RepID=A0ABD3QTA9_9STRA